MAKIQPSILLESAAGKAGTVVFYRHRGTLCMRARVSTPNPRTPAQIAARDRMSLASRVWKEMDPANVAAWNAYAATLPDHPTGNTAFIALATKFLQIQEGLGLSGQIPMLPPGEAFSPPEAQVTAEAEDGAIVFTIQSTEAEGCINPQSTNHNPQCAELLLQPLPSRNRAPESHRYASRAFTDWTDSLTVRIPVSAGAYAAAYRFVSPDTGQAGPLMPLPVVQVNA